MKYPSLEGKRYLNLARCSSERQADTSIPDQLTMFAAFGAEHRMVHVDDVILDGVSGSVPGARTDIDQIIRRKTEKNDFEVLLVQDTTRLTRGGIAHGNKLEWDLAAAGIEAVFVADNLVEGDFAALQKSMLYFSGKQHAKSISLATSRGSMSSLLADRSAHCRLPPYGIDRLYVAPDGTPLHVIRNLTDGTQVKLDPKGGAVLARFGTSGGRGTRTHYIKQKDERVVLVPAAPEAVAAINLIFRKYHIEGWGYRRIAEELNDLGVPAARGKQWSLTAVNQILHNPTYLGLGVANRQAAGIYSVRSPNQPKTSAVNERTLASSKAPPRKLRPREEWFERDEGRLKMLLNADVRRIALAKLDALMDKLAHVPQPRPRKDRHGESSYFLKGILTSKQGGHPMTGRTTGRRGKRVRYYSVSRGTTVPVRGSILKRIVAAEPVERAVVAAMREVLIAKDDLTDAVQRLARQRAESARLDDAELVKVRKDREATAAKLAFVIDELDEIGREAAKAKVAQLQAKLRNLDQRLTAASAPGRENGEQDAIEIADATMRQFEELARTIHELPPAALRRVVQLLVFKAEVDLETKAVQIELRLPRFAVASTDAIRAACASATDLHAGEQPRHTADTNDAAEAGIILALLDCQRQVQQKRVCYSCRRRAA